MLLVDRIIGDRSDAVLGKQLHRLEHMHAVDLIVLPHQELSRRRLRTRSENGRDVAITLSRDDQLYDGAVLLLDDSDALVVKVDAEQWLRVTAIDKSAALQLGFHAGNLHWRVRFDGDDLLIAIEREIGTYLERLELLVERGVISTRVEEGRQNA